MLASGNLKISLLNRIDSSRRHFSAFRANLLAARATKNKKNTSHRWVSKALGAFVSWLDVEASGVAEAVFDFCLNSIADRRVPASVKATLFDKVRYCSSCSFVFVFSV